MTIGDVSSRHEAKYYKTALHVRGMAVYELLTALLALELASQRKKFRNPCVRRNIKLKCSKTWMRRRYLDKVVTLLFRNNKQC